MVTEKKKSKEVITNTAYTMGGMLLMNGILQIIIYPLLTRRMGSASMGNVLYIMGLVAIICPSIGQSLNTSRLVVRREHEVSNGDYDSALLLYGAVGSIIALVAGYFYESYTGILSGIGVVLLIILTVFRYYADVEYRLNLNYKRYFIYYVFLSVGYLAGFGVYYLTGSWYPVFILGESAALAYVAFSGEVFHNFLSRSEKFPIVMSKGTILMLSYIITNTTLNIDRLVLRSLIDSTAVTQYYVISLIGKTLVLLIAPVNTIIISYLTRKEKTINRKQFLLFVGTGLGVSLVFFLACQIVTPLFVKIFYGEMYEQVHMYITGANLTQILGLLSAFLFIVVLTFTSEKWQLILQVGHLSVLLVLVVACTASYGMNGFIYANMTANVLRVLAVIGLGLWKVRKE